MSSSPAVPYLVVVAIITVVWHLQRKLKPFPPGPYALPVVGNLFNFVRGDPWKRADEWKQKFGSLVGLRVLGQPVVFIGDGAMALELLNKRGHIYSDRPQPVMACNMCQLDRLILFTRAGERYKHERKLIKPLLSLAAIEEWHPILTDEIQKLLHQLHNAPNQYEAHLALFLEAIMYRTTCGQPSKYATKGEGSPRVMISESINTVTEGWLVDYFPIIRWIPGARCRKVASDMREKLTSWMKEIREDFWQAPNSHEKQRSFCGRHLMSSPMNSPNVESHVEDVWSLAASLIIAGTDTTSVTLAQFILAMVLFPAEQNRAQQVLDQVVPANCFPTLADRSRLGYVDCLLKECIRWGTPLAIGPPHSLMEDDAINGYILPAGTVLFPNFRSIFHDKEIYPEPSAFNPERFLGLLDSNRGTSSDTGINPDPYTYFFGFGKRRCAGINLADQTLWLTVASILTYFSIEPDHESPGGIIRLEDAIEAGTVLRQPKPFKCRFTPRQSCSFYDKA